MTPFLFCCSSTGWVLGDQDCCINVLMDPSATLKIQTSYPRGIQGARANRWLLVEIFNQYDLGTGCRQEEFLRIKGDGSRKQTRSWKLLPFRENLSPTFLSHPLPPFLFPYFTYWVLGGQGWYVSAFTEASESFLPQMSQPGRLQVNIPPCWSPQENKGNRTRKEVGAPEISQRQKRMRHQEDTRSLKNPANIIEAVLPALPHICFPHVVCRVSGDHRCCVDVFTKASGKPKLQNSQSRGQQVDEQRAGVHMGKFKY